MKKVVVFWFRRDLRLQDNAGLYHALKSGEPVLPVFIFDTHILHKLANKSDARVAFIHRAISGIHDELKGMGSSLKVVHSTPLEAFSELLKDYDVKAVYTNHDYEPSAVERDDSVKAFLESKHIGFKTYKDQSIFEKNEVTKDDGKPYTVFTPYSRKWKAAMKDFYVNPYPTTTYFRNFLLTKPFSNSFFKRHGVQGNSG